MPSTAGSWAGNRFGRQAPLIRTRVTSALLEAQRGAREAHVAASSKDKFVYGTALWSKSYEAMVESFSDLPGATPVPMRGAPHQLILISGNLLVPYHFSENPDARLADARLPANGQGRLHRLLTEYGATSSWVAMSFPGLDEAPHEPLLPELDEPDPRLVLIAYACNANSDRIVGYWGEAALEPNNAISWLDYEQVCGIRDGKEGQMRAG